MWVLALLASFAVAQDYCDPSVVVNDRSPFKYQMRDTRCEGLYEQQVSSSVIALVSFYTTFEPFEPSEEVRGSITLDWHNAPGANRVNVRAVGIAYKLYYRMDAQVVADAKPFAWSKNVLDSLRIASKDIGVLAWSALTFGEGRDEVERDVFLPLEVYQTSPTNSSTYTVSVMPRMDLEKVYYRVATAEDGYRGELLSEKYTSLDHGNYPAGRPVTFQLEGLKEAPAGFYYLEVIADRGSDGASILPIYFYQSDQ